MRLIILNEIKFQMQNNAKNTRSGLVASAFFALSMAQDVNVYCDAKVKNGYTVLMHTIDESASGLTKKTFNFYGATPGEEIVFKIVDTCAGENVLATVGPLVANINGTLLREIERATASSNWSAADTLDAGSSSAAVQFWDGAETTLKACCEWSETRIDKLDKLKNGLSGLSSEDSPKSPKTPKTPKTPKP